MFPRRCRSDRRGARDHRKRKRPPVDPYPDLAKRSPSHPDDPHGEGQPGDVHSAMAGRAPSDDQKGEQSMTRKSIRYLGLSAALLLAAGCSPIGTSVPPVGTPGVNIADAALDGGMPETALNVTGAILRSNPRNVGALVRQGAALAQMNQPDAAMEAYQRALAVDPGSTAALLGLGRLQLSRGVALDLQGRHEAAQDVYGKLLRAAPNNRAGAINMALSLSLSGHADRSVAMLRGPASGPDASPRERQDLAVALTLSGNPREAAKLLLADLSSGDAAAAVAAYQALDAAKK
jgi:Flp pilus assembly protein TadD